MESESYSSVLEFAYFLDLKNVQKLIFRIWVLYTKEEIWGFKWMFVPSVNSIGLNNDFFFSCHEWFLCETVFNIEISMWQHGVKCYRKIIGNLIYVWYRDQAHKCKINISWQAVINKKLALVTVQGSQNSRYIMNIYKYRSKFFQLNL